MSQAGLGSRDPIARLPGQMLPSITRISQEEGVAKITPAKALKVLRSEGLTYSVAGWGTFVARDAQAD